MSNLETFLSKLKNEAENIDFAETMAVVDEFYDFSETGFKNGEQRNEAGQNNGSCKLFAFAQDQNLSDAETLACFGQYYRDDVLKNPEGEDHQNIRNFMISGWQGITFDAPALKRKS